MSLDSRAARPRKDEQPHGHEHRRTVVTQPDAHCNTMPDIKGLPKLAHSLRCVYIIPLAQRAPSTRGH